MLLVLVLVLFLVVLTYLIIDRTYVRFTEYVSI